MLYEFRNYIDDAQVFSTFKTFQNIDHGLGIPGTVCLHGFISFYNIISALYQVFVFSVYRFASQCIVG